MQEAIDERLGYLSASNPFVEPRPRGGQLRLRRLAIACGIEGPRRIEQQFRPVSRHHAQPFETWQITHTLNRIWSSA